MLNSIGTEAYTFQTDISVNFGAGSYNFSTGELDYFGREKFNGGDWGWDDLGYGIGGLANLSDVAKGLDKLTHWEDKIAAKANATADASGHSLEDGTNFNSNIGGRSYPGSNNPRLKGGGEYFGKSPNWGHKEYSPYLHDIDYSVKGIKGIGGYLTSNKAISGDWKFVGRQMFLSLKHTDPVGFLISTVSGAAFIPKSSVYPFTLPFR